MLRGTDNLGYADKNPGFTLIELLVVIAIIGLLSTMAIVGLNSSRLKARDAERRFDLNQMTKALMLYWEDNGVYPTTAGAWWGTCSSYGSHGTSGASGWIPNIAPAYVAVLPTDPNPIGASYCYLYRSDGTNYKILAYETVESTRPVPVSDAMRDPAGRVNSFAVYTTGASAW